MSMVNTLVLYQHKGRTLLVWLAGDEADVEQW